MLTRENYSREHILELQKDSGRTVSIYQSGGAEEDR